jgi:hypothetical protein
VPAPRRSTVTVSLCAALVGCHTHHVIGRDGRGYAPCPAYASGADLAICTGTYLGHGGTVSNAAAAFEPDGKLLVAATAPALSFDSDTDVLFGGGAGLLLRLDHEGRNLFQIARVGDAVSDVRVDAASRAIVVAGRPFGVARLGPALRDVAWSDATGADRVAVAAGGGTIAALATNGAAVTVYDGDGHRVGAFAAGGGGAARGNDVALDAADRLVIVTGFVDATPARPFVEAYAYDGTPAWRSEGWTGGDAVALQLLAGTRGERVANGKPGELVYLGVSDGGNTVHQRDPHDLTRATTTAAIDRYSDPSAIGASALTFIARLRAKDGALLSAVFHAPRNDAMLGRGRDAVARALAVDDRGRVLIAGTQGCCGSGSIRSVAGAPLAQVDGDGFAALFGPALDARPLWTTFGTGGGADFVAAAVFGGRAAIVGLQPQGQAVAGALVTFDAIRAQPGGEAASLYLADLPLPP